MLRQPDLWDLELPNPAKKAAGPLTMAPSWAVQEGDAFKLIESLPPASIDLILTSPPYWGQRTYNGSHNWEILREWETECDSSEQVPPYDWYIAHGGVLGLEPYPHWYVFYLVQFFEAAKRALKKTGSLWVNMGDTYFARWASIRDRGRQGLGNNPRQRRRVPMGSYRQEKQLLLIPARFAIAMQEHRWILRNDLIWFKPNVPPRPEKDRLRLAHEHFFHFVHRPKEGRAKYYYNLDKAEPAAVDVATVNVKAGQDNHSATFPEALILPRILTSCPPGGTVLDPFAGTGRTLAVALANRRNAIAFEIDPGFAQAARRRAVESISNAL